MNFFKFAFALILFCIPSFPAIAQTFDERASDWPEPLRISGTIIGMADLQARGDWLDTLVAAAGGEEAIMVAIDLSDHGETEFPDAVEVAEQSQFEIHSNSSDSALDESRSEEISRALETATGVWLAGDDSIDPSQVKKLQLIRDDLAEVVRRGGAIATSGDATAMLGRYRILGGQLLGDQALATVGPGLDLIADTVITTDFDDDQGRPQLLSVLAAHPRLIGVGLDPQTGFVIRGRKIRALGSGKAHFTIMANDRLPLRTQSISEPPSRRVNPYDYIIDWTAWRRDAIDRTLPVFPPQNPNPPKIENGTLIMVGGGGLPDGLMEEFIERTGGEDARLVYIPCRESERLRRRKNRMVEAWRKAGVKSADIVHTKDRNKADNDQDFLEPLSNATGIFFGGGRQWNFSDSYYGTKAHRLMKDVLKRGGVVMGSSAGASIQARYLARANPIGNIDIMAPGYERGDLGFISGVAIDQHFTQRGRQKDMTQLVNTYPQLLGIGLDESTALVVTGSIGEVVGEGRVFFYDRNTRAPHDDPDYIALKAGEKYDLAKRQVVTDPQR